MARKENLISPYRIECFDIDTEKYKHFNHKLNCTICGREFWSHKVGKFWVQTCGSCDLYVTCANQECRKENLILDHPTRTLQNIKNNKISACDNTCTIKAKIQQNKNKICHTCGGNNINIMGLCMDCHNNEINDSINCPIHGYQEYSFAGKCIKCINESQKDRLSDLATKNCEKANNGFWKTEEGKGLQSEIANKNFIIHNSFCPICETKTEHKGSVCLICDPKARGNTIPNFITKDNGLWYLDHLTRQYVPWEEFKSRFDTTNVDFLDKIRVDYPNTKLIPTFRSQESTTWKGARGAFEQSLIEQNISWCTHTSNFTSTRMESPSLLL